MNNGKSLKFTVLDRKESDLFAQQFGPSLKSDLPDWIQSIVSEAPSETGFKRLNTLAWFIFIELQGVAFGEKPRFVVCDTAVQFQKLMYELNVFLTLQVPYERWEVVVKALFQALSSDSCDDELHFQSERFESVRDLANHTLRDVLGDPKYSERFTDFLNGAL